MNSHLYIFGNDNMLITVNGVFLGNASSPITFLTEENALLYFSVMPFGCDFRPFAFSLKVGTNMTIPNEFGYVITLPSNRYEIRLEAPKYPELTPLPVPKIVKSITVKSNSKNTMIITDVKNSDIQNIQKSEPINNYPKVIPAPITIQEQIEIKNDAVNITEPTEQSLLIQNEDDTAKKHNEYKNESSANSTLTLNPDKSTKKSTTLKTYKVSIIEDVRTRLCIECGKDVFYHTLPQNLTNINLKAEILNNELVACVTAEENIDQYKILYLLIIKGTLGKYLVKLDGFWDKITQEGKKIITLKLKGDIACRGLKTVYDGQTFEKTEEYYVYCKGEPVRTTDTRLMPIAVFEAVKCKDFQEAKYYLTESLNQILTAEKLEDFFGEYEEIFPNHYYSQYPHSFLLVDRSNKATLINTVYKNNKIDNFVEIEF